MCVRAVKGRWVYAARARVCVWCARARAHVHVRACVSVPIYVALAIFPQYLLPNIFRNQDSQTRGFGPRNSTGNRLLFGCHGMPMRHLQRSGKADYNPSFSGVARL